MGMSSKLNGTLRDFISRQHMFFVATAAKGGRVNVSPKGMDSLRVVDDTHILWLNLTGSGNETAAHLLDTPRMTLMFCAFEGNALILRTYGTARVINRRDPSWEDALMQFPKMAGSRQIFEQQIDLVQTSCGTGVPFMSFEGDRGADEMVKFWDDMGTDGVEKYWRKKNVESLDGAPTGLFE